MKPFTTKTTLTLFWLYELACFTQHLQINASSFICSLNAGHLVPNTERDFGIAASNAHMSLLLHA